MSHSRGTRKPAKPMDDSAVQPIISSQHDALPVVAPSAHTVPNADAPSADVAPAPIMSVVSVSLVAAPSVIVPDANGVPDETAAPAAQPISSPSSEEQRPLRPSDPMIVFAYECLRREFEALLARQPASNAPPPAEDVHQMRIATRRLRIALRLFRRMLPNEAKQFRKDFGSFARALGDVRDLDVYSENFRAYAQAISPENIGELGGYELHLRRERAEARNNLSTLFADERHAALLRSFAALLEGAPSSAAVRRWRSFKVADGVDKYLKKSLKRVLKLGNKIGENARAEELHELRIRTKRFRYELEFFVAVYPSLAKTAKASKALQDLLGVHQDACTATERLEAYARSLRKRGASASPKSPALGTLVEGQERQALEVRQKFSTAWHSFERTVARGKLAP